jgi:hypothetical protein
MTVSKEINLHVIQGSGGGPDGGGDLSAALDRARVEIDADILRSGAAARVTAAVLAEVGIMPSHRLRWVAIAATLVIAAGLGSLFEATRQPTPADMNVVVLDPLTFSAVAVNQ